MYSNNTLKMGAWEDGWIADIQVTLVTEEKLRHYQRRKYTHLQTKLFKYWEQYREGTLSTTTMWRWAGRLETYSHGVYDVWTVSDVFWCTFLYIVKHRYFFPNKKLNISKGCSSFPSSEPYKLPPCIATTKNKVVSYQRQFVPSLEVPTYNNNNNKKKKKVISYSSQFVLSLEVGTKWPGYEMTKMGTKWLRVRNDLGTKQ